MIDFKGHRFEQDIILASVRWYLAYPLSYRNLEEMLAERGGRSRSFQRLSLGPEAHAATGSGLPQRPQEACRQPLAGG